MDWPKEYSKISHPVRAAAYKLFEVEAITRSVLLPGQEKTAYHGGPLTTDYYLFLFTSRENPKQFGYFTCGVHAGKGWLDLNGQRHEDIASYNPLTGESSGGGGGGSTHRSASERNPRMKRLIRVLQTFISLTDDTKRKIKGEPTTLTVLKKLIKSSKDAPERSNVRAVNTILYKSLKDGSHGGAHTFSQLIEHYEKVLCVSFKRIDIDDFNQEIDDTRNQSANYSYIPLASF
jgi:hypothetical protein